MSGPGRKPRLPRCRRRSRTGSRACAPCLLLPATPCLGLGPAAAATRSGSTFRTFPIFLTFPISRTGGGRGRSASTERDRVAGPPRNKFLQHRLQLLLPSRAARQAPHVAERALCGACQGVRQPLRIWRAHRLLARRRAAGLAAFVIRQGDGHGGRPCTPGPVGHAQHPDQRSSARRSLVSFHRRAWCSTWAEPRRSCLPA